MPGIEKITICELEPLIPPAATKYFGAENYTVLRDPRTTIHYDDARHYVLTTKDKFDVIRINCHSPFPTEDLFHAKTNILKPMLVEIVEVAVRSGSVDQ